MEKTQEETVKPTIIVERPEFMEPVPTPTLSPKPKTSPTSEAAIRARAKTGTPKQKTE